MVWCYNMGLQFEAPVWCSSVGFQGAALIWCSNVGRQCENSALGFHGKLYRCIVYYTVGSTSLQCGIPVGASTVGFPYGQREAPSVGPMWRIRCGFQVRGSIGDSKDGLSCGVPEWGYSVGHQCETPV